MNINVTFNDLFQVAIRHAEAIPYNPGWANGTGYFDALAKLSIRSVCKSVDPHGRTILMIPHDVGTIVIFQRLPPSAQNGRLCFHYPMSIHRPGDKTYITAGGETFLDPDTVSATARERQMNVRLALLTAVIHLTHSVFRK